MKIRIKGNSVRFRLTKSEVEKLCKDGEIFDSTNFGNAKFSYGVVLNKFIEVLNIKYQDNSIIMELPYKTGNTWYANSIIGFDNVQKITTGNEIALLLEKDFTCMDNILEDQSDNYPNPRLKS